MSPGQATELATKYRALAEFCAAKAEGKELQILWMHHATHASNERPFPVWQTTDSVPTIDADLSRWRVKPEPRKAWSVRNMLTEDRVEARRWSENGHIVTEWQEVIK